MNKSISRPILGKHTEAGVYIIESLDFEDENTPKEGKMISDILELSGIENTYQYVRTKAELIYFIDDFAHSNLRFLHLSCHGDNNSITTTLDNISHIELSKILYGKLKFRRLFLSACSTVNDSLAKYLFKNSGCNSIVGPNEDVHMDEIAIFWASFYHLMFKNNPSAMKKKDLVATLDSLVKLYNVPICYYKKSTRSPYYNEEKIEQSTPKPKFEDFT